MQSVKAYVSPVIEFIKLDEEVLTAVSCEHRWSDTGEVAVEDGVIVYCDCTSYGGGDFTKSDPWS